MSDKACNAITIATSAAGQNEYNDAPTKDDLAAVQYANKLIARCLVVVDLEQLLLREHHEALAPLALGHVEVLLLEPPKQRDTLRQHPIALEVVRRDRPRGHRARELRREREVVEAVHDELLHALHRVLKVRV